MMIGDCKRPSNKESKVKRINKRLQWTLNLMFAMVQCIKKNSSTLHECDNTGSSFLNCSKIAKPFISDIALYRTAPECVDRRQRGSI